MEEERKIPFMEQVELFAKTMNERFIEGKTDSGKVLIVFAMDANSEKRAEGKISHIAAVYGEHFDTAYCLMTAFRNKHILDVLEKTASLSALSAAMFSKNSSDD